MEDISLRRPTLDEVFLALTGKTSAKGTGAGTNGGRNERRRNEGGRSMTMDITLDRPDGVALRPRTEENSGAAYLTASGQVAARTLKKFVRTPALIVAGTAGQGVLFLLIFRYVFGGAVSAVTGSLSYVDFLVPGFVVTGVLFQGMSASSGVAEDLQAASSTGCARCRSGCSPS